ncbi:SRPBCC family protein [Shimia sp. R10_1]|uniref:SRPBCC family protein n=1 Tax=Shimia sp. R10_1 TaxID=2821095 RepID=UPI001ADAC8F0|nr:SRPBCC family protein [Shimia sp. R10_1]MBO9474526.1 SRPBCC family protein [Shimia sp. R10_1]
MELTGREDIDVPIEQAFIMLSDVEVYERSALRRGAEVTRLDSLPQAGVGAIWEIAFLLRGKPRTVNLEMTRLDAPNEIAMRAKIQGLETDIKFELVALSRTKTRVQFWSGMKAKTLSSRLLLQSLKLARNNINKRIRSRLTGMRADLEERYRQST